MTVIVIAFVFGVVVGVGAFIICAALYLWRFVKGQAVHSVAGNESDFRGKSLGKPFPPACQESPLKESRVIPSPQIDDPRYDVLMQIAPLRSFTLN